MSHAHDSKNHLLDDTEVLQGDLAPGAPVLVPLPRVPGVSAALARLHWLSDAVFETVDRARWNKEERTALAWEASHLLEQLGAQLRGIEEADPADVTWAAMPRPPGSRHPLEPG